MLTQIHEIKQVKVIEV